MENNNQTTPQFDPNTGAPIAQTPAVDQNAGAPIAQAPTFDPNTGAPIAQAPAFDPNTGAPIAQAPAFDPNTGAPVQYTAQYAPATAKKPMSKQLKMGLLFGGIGLVVVVIAIILCVALFGGPKFDIAKYNTIKVTGLNGGAKATVVVDTTSKAFEAACEEAGISSLTDTLRYLEFSDFMYSMEFTLSKEEGISNGETITATAIYDKDTAEDLGIRVVNEVISIKVEGLENGIPKDVFADLEIEYSGISPNGRVSFNNNNADSFIRTVSYHAEPSYDLKNGDKIVVTASYDEDEAIENKYVIPATTKEYIVAGLDEYVTETNYITIKEELKTKADAKAKEIIDNRYNSDQYTAPTFVSSNLLTIKDPDDVGWFTSYNRIVYIYKTKYTARYSFEESGERYFAIYAEDVSISTGDKVDEDLYLGFTIPGDDDTQQSVEDEQINDYKEDYIITEIK